MDAYRLIAILCDKSDYSPAPQSETQRGSATTYTLLNTDGAGLQLTRGHFASIILRWRNGRLSKQALADIGSFVSLYDEVFSFSDAETERLFGSLDHPDTNLDQLANEFETSQMTHPDHPQA